MSTPPTMPRPRSPAPRRRRRGDAPPDGAPGAGDSMLALIAAEMARIEADVRSAEAKHERAIGVVAPGWVESARNLVHYIALRRIDLRELQLVLQQRGLSSLGRSESFVLGSLLEVAARAVEALVVRGAMERAALAALDARRGGALTWETAKYMLHEHTRDALGPRPSGRHVYVMVTAPSAAEGDAAWCARMLRAGMNVLRINCAHEDEAAWTKVIEALKTARRETGLECRLMMDLAGPKIRTGPIADRRRVLAWKLARDELGRVLHPTRVALRPASELGARGSTRPALLLPDAAHAKLSEGDRLRFEDSRGKKRELVVRREGEELFGESTKRAWVVEGTPAIIVRGNKKIGSARLTPATTREPFLELRAGDLLFLSRRPVIGSPADAEAGTCATVACTLPAALDAVAPGHRVLFDDGKIEGVAEEVTDDGVLVRVRRSQRVVTKLRPEKGINLPDSKVPVTSLTDEDRRNLAFAARHADLVGMSFVRSAEDVRDLHEELERLDCPGVGTVLKIETKAGFENLPRILLEGMRRPPLAVMIARGDLAVEVGFERLAELQDEILWVCEASHVPAIWATQVLDTLARTGVPSRAEVTDAAASVGAECVMLNKGPYVAEAVTTLVNILQRMERHRYKKRSIFRQLKVALSP